MNYSDVVGGDELLRWFGEFRRSTTAKSSVYPSVEPGPAIEGAWLDHDRRGRSRRIFRAGQARSRNLFP